MAVTAESPRHDRLQKGKYNFKIYNNNLKIAELRVSIRAFEMLRLEIVWTSWAIPRLFAIRHLPNIVKFQQFQTSKILCIFCNFVSKLSFSFCFTS